MKRALLLGVLVAGCHPQDIDPLEQQPKYKAYAPNDFFADGRAMRPLPDNVVPRERELDPQAPPVTHDLIELGRERYDVVCAVCHGVAGDGDSVVASKMGLKPAPSLHDDRIRALPGERIYQIITEGYGLMPRYAPMLPPRERWGVVAYVRALQLSQNLPFADAPEDLRRLAK